MNFKVKTWRCLLPILMLLQAAPLLAATYITPTEFVATSFSAQPEQGLIWLKAPEQAMAVKLFGHRYAGLRLRYWRTDERTAWILDEIGKERMITMGIVVDQDQISRVAILEYRESRGGEIRHPFFTQQFVGASMDSKQDLSNPIDGISGATLSYLHDLVLSQSAEAKAPFTSQDSAQNTYAPGR
jgi:hypothetical protein